MKTLIALLVVLLAPLAAHAQDVNVAALDDGTNVVTVTTGAEYGLVLGAGYARVAAVADLLPSSNSGRTPEKRQTMSSRPTGRRK